MAWARAVMLYIYIYIYDNVSCNVNFIRPLPVKHYPLKQSVLVLANLRTQDVSQTNVRERVPYV